MAATSRRRFLQQASRLSWAAMGSQWLGASTWGGPHSQIPLGLRGTQHESVRVLNPRNRVPVSFIVDDSTCLVNMGHFCMPQFATAWPDRKEYHHPWQTWPREIPDSFVREFGEWCAEQGVKGKYSIVPYPACVGWLDRELPGWSRKQLEASLQLVRDLMVPHWDIHPEMITHTRVIDLKTGRPFPEISSATMENSYPREKTSVDELAAYLAYALKILKNCDLPCDGVTTPGGFGNLVKPELSQAVFESVRDIYGSEIPHYFKYVIDPGESTQPQLEHVSGTTAADRKITVNVVAGTGDWFGGWDGVQTPEPDRYATVDGEGGRVVQMIRNGEPAVFLCHWPGLYCNGTKTGLQAFQQVVTSINSHHGDRITWMKVSEIARYWAAKGMTQIERKGATIQFSAPYACPAWTVQVTGSTTTRPVYRSGTTSTPLQEARNLDTLQPGQWLGDPATNKVTLCFDLIQGLSEVVLST
ncbi:MAG: hypothetical protein R3C01_06070 [Planctomycetaceae bacterium]